VASPNIQIGCKLFRNPLNRSPGPIFGLWALVIGMLAAFLAARLVRTTEFLKDCALPEDAARGRAWAPTCKACHDIAATEPAVFTQGSGSSGGPNLQDVYGSLAGTTPAPFSPTAAPHPLPPLAAARDAGVIWTDDNLFQYLGGPKQFLEKKTGKSFADAFYMSFFIGEEPARRNVIAYLKAINGHPECD
jgi:cytochrome c